MGGFLSALLPFWSSPKNYDEVLQKLSGFCVYEVWAISFFLRTICEVDKFLSNIEHWGPIGKALGIIPSYEIYNISGLFIAIIVAVLTKMFQIHDRISDVIGLRRRFDRNNILIPLALSVGSVVTDALRKKIAINRDKLMRPVFYKYASSRAEKPLVDKHDIEQALGMWWWFWVFVEAIAYLLVAALIAWCVGGAQEAKTLLWIALGCFAMSLLLRMRLNRYARPQVEAIAADPTAAADVKKEFDAL